jgi:hypothetical protein
MRVEEGNILGYSLGSGAVPSGQHRRATTLLFVCTCLSPGRRRAGVRMLQNRSMGVMQKRSGVMCEVEKL